MGCSVSLRVRTLFAAEGCQDFPPQRKQRGRIALACAC